MTWAIHVLPVDGRVTKHGGYRFNRGAGVIHAGVDLGVPRGAKVRAPADSIVVKVDRQGRQGSGWHGYAPVILLLDTEGRYHVLAHLERTAVRAGDEVQAGQVIATVGPLRHLHWEVRSQPIPDYSAGQKPRDIATDPLTWLRTTPAA